MFSKWVGRIGNPAVGMMRKAGALAGREAAYLQGEMAQLRGLVPLLARSRDSRSWDATDKALLQGHLRRMTSLSPYLVLAIMPGSFVALPLLALWRDRRRSRRLAAANARP